MSVCRDQEEQPFADVLQNVFGVFKYFEKLTGKDLRWSLFLIKLQALTPPQLFSCKFCEISKKTFLQKTSERLLLYEVFYL